MNIQPNNKEKIALFNEELFISERIARDVNSLAEYASSKENSYTENLFQSIKIIEDALKINFDQLKWYQLLKRLRLKRKLRSSYIYNNLTPSQIFDLSYKILELEGVDLKKKTSLNSQ